METLKVYVETNLLYSSLKSFLYRVLADVLSVHIRTLFAQKVPSAEK